MDIKKLLTYEEAKNFIYAFDFNYIYERLLRDSFGPKEASDAIEAYRKYMLLIYLHNHVDYPPSYQIDVVWKQHLLQPENYQAFCFRLFSDNILPKNFDLDDNDELAGIKSKFYRTSTLYKELFGEKLIFGKENFLEKRIIGFKIKSIISTISASIIIPAMPIIYAIVSNYNTNIVLEHTSLRTRLGKVYGERQELCSLCNKMENKNVSDYDKNFIKEKIFDRRMILRNYLEDYTMLARILKDKKVLSPKSFSTLKNDAAQSDEIASATLAVCTHPLVCKNIAKADRKKMERVISKNQEEHKGIICWIRSLFLW